MPINLVVWDWDQTLAGDHDNKLCYPKEMVVLLTLLNYFEVKLAIATCNDKVDGILKCLDDLMPTRRFLKLDSIQYCAEKSGTLSDDEFYEGKNAGDYWWYFSQSKNELLTKLKSKHPTIPSYRVHKVIMLEHLMQQFGISNKEEILFVDNDEIHFKPAREAGFPVVDMNQYFKEHMPKPKIEYIREVAQRVLVPLCNQKLSDIIGSMSTLDQVLLGCNSEVNLYETYRETKFNLGKMINAYELAGDSIRVAQCQMLLAELYTKTEKLQEDSAFTGPDPLKGRYQIRRIDCAVEICRALEHSEAQSTSTTIERERIRRGLELLLKESKIEAESHQPSPLVPSFFTTPQPLLAEIIEQNDTNHKTGTQLKNLAGLITYLNQGLSNIEKIRLIPVPPYINTAKPTAHSSTLMAAAAAAAAAGTAARSTDTSSASIAASAATPADSPTTPLSFTTALSKVTAAGTKTSPLGDIQSPQAGM